MNRLRCRFLFHLRVPLIHSIIDANPCPLAGTNGRPLRVQHNDCNGQHAAVVRWGQWMPGGTFSYTFNRLPACCKFLINIYTHAHANTYAYTHTHTQTHVYMQINIYRLSLLRNSHGHGLGFVLAPRLDLRFTLVIQAVRQPAGRPASWTRQRIVLGASKPALNISASVFVFFIFLHSFVCTRLHFNSPRHLQSRLSRTLTTPNLRQYRTSCTLADGSQCCFPQIHFISPQLHKYIFTSMPIKYNILKTQTI